VELTLERQKSTGAFYTPKIWADKAVQYIAEIVPNMQDYLFYDPAAGEGALLEALPSNVEKYATTLEREDVTILRDKGIIANQFDFLNGDISKLHYLRENAHRIIVLTNPPYLKSTPDCLAKNMYKSNDSTALFIYRIVNEIKPILICTFSKLDLFQASSQQQFRRDIPIFEMTNKMFLTPSKSWGLKGNFPISFSILINKN